MALLHKSYPDLDVIELSVGGIASTVEPYLPFLSKNPTEIQIIVLFVFLRSWVRRLFFRNLFCVFCTFRFGGSRKKVYVFEHHKKRGEILVVSLLFFDKKNADV